MSGRIGLSLCDREGAEMTLPQHLRPEDEEAIEYLIGWRANLEVEVEELRFKGMFASTSAERVEAQNKLTEIRFERARANNKLDELGYDPAQV